MPVLGGCRPWPDKDHLSGMDLTVGVGVGGQGQLVIGGQLGELHDGTQYLEVRQFCSVSGHHLVCFYFFTRVYS